MLLTTYEVVLNDRDVLAPIKWAYLAVDEAHRLKNNNARLYSELMVRWRRHSGGGEVGGGG